MVKLHNQHYTLFANANSTQAYPNRARENALSCNTAAHNGCLSASGRL